MRAPYLAAALIACVATHSAAQSLSGGGGRPAWPASGVTPVTSTLTSATQSSSFTPVAGGGFHVVLSGTGIGTCQLERQVDGVNWATYTITSAGNTIQIYNWTLPGGEVYSEDVLESQAAVPYRLNCTGYTSGNIVVAFYQ